MRSKTINLDGDEMGMDDEIMTSLRSESVDKISKDPKSPQVRATKKRDTKVNLEMKRKLEDAEYKDLKQRYHEDERDKNYVLNEREAIEEAADKESEGGNELNESIDKLEEEQDLEFKDKVALISHEFMKDIKFLDEEKDATELNSLHKAMIQKVFDCFLENKQELLKKIAGKLASQKDIEEYLSLDSDPDRGEDDTTPRYGQNRKSDASYQSKAGKKRKRTEDTMMQDSKSGMSSKDNDFMENIMDVSHSNYERNDSYDSSPQKNLERKIRKDKSRKRQRDFSKGNDSVRTNLLNIQTTADLISYVKRRQNKRIMRQKRGSKVSKKAGGIVPSRITRRDGGSHPSIRHFGVFQQGGRSIEIQTDDLDILDLRCSEINLTEVYHFDKISACLRKIVIERGVDAEILRQFEYLHKDAIKNRYRSRTSVMGKYGKHLNKQDQFRKNISDVVAKVEVTRYNDALKALINKVKDYEHENAYLEEKRSCMSSQFPLFKESEDDVFNRGWRKGYSAGYTRGNSNGFFKGSIEAQYIGHQKGVEEGMQEGWNFGFDEGFKTGIRKVFRDAREAGIDLSSLELMEYISKEDKIKGLMKNLYTKLTKVFAISERLEASSKLNERFMGYSDRRKRLAVKMGKKNMFKAVTNYFTSKIKTKSHHLLLCEFLYTQCIEKYGNSKLADKKLIQVFAASVYHQKNERVGIFCRALHLSEKRNYSNDILNIYLYILSQFQREYNTRINAIKDDITEGQCDFAPFVKGVEIFKEMFEDKIPMYPKLKLQVDKMMITKSSMKMIDVDKFSNFVIVNYMKYYINLNSPEEIIYNAWTLYEVNYITMNELYVTTELLQPPTILVDIPEESKQVNISKEQFYNLFSEHLKGKTNENIYSHQFKEVMSKVDTFSPRRVKKLFDLSLCNMTIAQFKEEYFGISTILKERLDELYKGKKWRQINRLDVKEVWLNKIHAVSRAIGTVNITLLKISLKLIKESIDFFLKQKRELLGGREDESDEEEVKENTSETGVTKEPQRKVSNTKLSRNITKINDNSGERVSIEQKSSMTSHSIFKMNSNKKGTKLSSTKIKDNIIQNEAQTQLSRGSSVASKARRARKSMSTQKTVMARSGFKNNKMPSFGGANFR